MVTAATPFGPRLAGKVAAISGIGSGQGRAAAILFATHGAKVVGCDVHGRNAKEAADEANHAATAAESGGEVVAVKADVFEEAGVEEWIGTAIERFERLDVLYNNAARGDFAMVEDMDLERWRNAIGFELNGVYLGCRHAFPHLKRDPDSDAWSSVINTASVSGMISTYLPNMGGGMAHAAGKAGVIGLTRSLADEYAPVGIRVNAISPGSVWTPGLAEWGYDTPEFLANVTAKLLIKRRAQPEEVAQCALFLASDESSYITGVNIPVDGGWTSF
ncbi:MAG: SDR family oxidoreductase [Acidimicrobiia bacterium]|nr:SDR family oxidoreductase [Acidimicrobiia bacterium]